MTAIVLVGGPDGLGPLYDLQGDELPEKIAVAFYGCHQHFEHAGECVRIDGRDLALFRFTYRTAIAE
ncbi:DUF5988 family protein [Streptomyces sp. NBC_00536]|uniref:DUF5988 family protein n=1 Tax=Streptomyces sp. NBC_00536 TaxID=2975769 RepID=UPI002E820E3C|nr:DUF5988 family protein [Streptomyces sp. NBC_00536]WUC83205.1 DUF5988 family protein [Streptomyces sp. NBC_00536]